MAEIVSLADGIAAVVHDGDTVAMEGFTHLIPFAAGHEVIRQGRRDLTLIRMTPDLIYDQLIGMGCARKLIFSWGGNPGVGSLHRFRDAVENGWPGPLELEEHSHAGMANRYVAGACGSAVRRPARLRRHRPAGNTPTFAPDHCPFTGEALTAVPALRPDVAIIHAQRADRRATCSSGGSPACRRRPCSPPSAHGHRRGGRRRARAAAERRRAPHCWSRPRRRRSARVVRTRRMRTATTSVTTRSTPRGTRSRATATRSAGGWNVPNTSRARSGRPAALRPRMRVIGRRR